MRVVLVLFSVTPFVAAGEKPATIRGVVRFLGDVPADRKIMTTDGGTIVHNDLVVDAKTKGLRDVAVYLEKAPPHKIAAEMITAWERMLLQAQHGRLKYKPNFGVFFGDGMWRGEELWPWDTRQRRR